MTFGRHFASSLGRFRFSFTSALSEPAARSYSMDVSHLIAAGGEHRDEVMPVFLMNAPEVATHAETIRKLRKRPGQTSTLVMNERPVGHERQTFLHHRGEYLQPRDNVQAGLPGFLLSDAQAPTNRLEFARWLVSADNPLTARVVVNRQWDSFFGTGIVKTLGDFGLQGEPPSHPKLLDWLAATFIEKDRWSIREIHRRIVSSATYRQSANVSVDSLRRDPNNRLLSYSPRFRLDAEIVRDQLLNAAGILSRKIGGPSVRPPQPSGVTESRQR